MTGKDDIRREVEQTMASMDKMEILEAGPYFFQKVNARLRQHERQTLPGFLGWVNTVVLRPAVLTIIVLINLVSAVVMFRGGGGETTVSTTEKQISYAAAFVADYYLGDSQDSFDDYFREKTGEGGN